MNIEDMADEMHASIMRQRSRIIEAFIAETGLLPSECEQVTQGNRWWIRKRRGMPYPYPATVPIDDPMIKPSLADKTYTFNGMPVTLEFDDT